MSEEGVEVPVQTIQVIPPAVVNVEPKMWYQSTELWTAIIATVGFILQSIFGNIILPPDIQAAILSVLMFILRSLKPIRGPIAWTAGHLEVLKSEV